MFRGPFVALLAVVVGIICVNGCGNTEFGQDARVPVSQRHVLAAGSPAGAALDLPGGHEFNIHVKQSSQDKGAGGEATSQSDATPTGKALARADTAKGGAAKAEFKIGHRIDNTTSSNQAVSANISFNLRQAVEASEVPAPDTLAKANLVLIVVDSHKRAVSKTTIVQATSDDASGTANMPQERHVTARLEPGETYDIVLYGTVEAASADKQHSTASLEIDDLKMSLTFAPIATQPAANQP
jgi:hypothetical protein